MHLLRDEALVRRTAGLTILLGLVALLSDKWRDSIVSDGIYSTGVYDLADVLLHVSFALAVAGAAVVGLSLLTTPRDSRPRDVVPGAGVGISDPR